MIVLLPHLLSWYIADNHSALVLEVIGCLLFVGFDSVVNVTRSISCYTVVADV